jgi:hypothetical protein
MLATIESISMMLLCLQAAYLTFHCHKWKFERAEFVQFAKAATTELTEDFREFGNLLTDIADILDNSSTATTNHTPSGAGDLITNFLISRFNDAQSSGNNGNTTQIERKVHQAVSEEKFPEVQESD